MTVFLRTNWLCCEVRYVGKDFMFGGNIINVNQFHHIRGLAVAERGLIAKLRAVEVEIEELTARCTSG